MVAEGRITSWLKQSNQLVFALYTMSVAFCTYSCMYAFRKPFAVASFEGQEYWGVDLKILFISAQVIGYMLSKFIGIKVISEMGAKNRATAILFLIGLSAAALLGFALSQPPLSILFMFFNGLPLGMVWGIVFSYLEGRRTTEILGAGLSISFIFSSGVVKSIGKWLMVSHGVSEFWMPLMVGLIFTFPLVFFVFLLDRVPAPNAKDIEQRTVRMPMKGAERIRFISTFGPGLLSLIIVYSMLTALRDLRDNYAAEIWEQLGYGQSAAIFTATEIPISIGVLIIIGSVMFIKSNRVAFVVNHLIILTGLLLVGIGTWLFQLDILGGLDWMILIGFGLYLGYVPFNSIFFDRFIAVFKYASNVGFLIYLADSFGYLSSVAILFVKNFGQTESTWLTFFAAGGYAVSIFGSGFLLYSIFFFTRKLRKWNYSRLPGSPIQTEVLTKPTRPGS